jgi:NAD(P)-dependent dehydrogenase (short-subunit alcohol dehydrogenase family)
MSINVDSVFLLTQSLLPLLELSDNASIIFTTANEGKKGKAYWGAYSVSKFATEGLMQILADELEHTSSIRVNSINPVAVKSKLRKKAFPAEDPNSVPLPKDFIKLYLYLISDLSKECKGKSIDVQIV